MWMLNDDNPDLSMLELMSGRFGEPETDPDGPTDRGDATEATASATETRKPLDTKTTSIFGTDDRAMRTNRSGGAVMERVGSAHRMSSASKLGGQSSENTRPRESRSHRESGKAHRIPNSPNPDTMVEVGMHGAELPFSSPLSSSRCSTTSLCNQAPEGRIQDAPATAPRSRATRGVRPQKPYGRKNFRTAHVRPAAGQLAGSRSPDLSRSAMPNCSNRASPVNRHRSSNRALGEAESVNFIRIQPPPPPSPPVVPDTVIGGCTGTRGPILGLAEKRSPQTTYTPVLERTGTAGRQCNMAPSTAASVVASGGGGTCKFSTARPDQMRMAFGSEAAKASRLNAEPGPNAPPNHGSEWRQQNRTQLENVFCDVLPGKGDAAFSPVFNDRVRGTPRRRAGKPRYRGAASFRNYVDASVIPRERAETRTWRRTSFVKETPIRHDQSDGIDCAPPRQLQMAASHSEGHPLAMAHLRWDNREKDSLQPRT
uniref:Uncharacterized protein n=1 Tax=Neospora caninum (strain Liverpool) TaxID=572307 RepID=A0A0F7UGZ3_NEOCL|nr:TPA: hypothetical protein BN1204_040435 [Neospora caninum Liverpool]